MRRNRPAQIANFLFIAFVGGAIEGCARGDESGDTPGPSGSSLGSTGLGGSGSDMGASGAGVNSGGSAAGATGTGTSGGAVSGAATAGTVSTGSATSGTIAGGSATSGTIASGSATSGTIASGSATSGTIASGSATTGTASTGTATSGSVTSDAAASGDATSGTASSGSAASGTASSGDAGLTLVARLNINGPDHAGVDYPGLWQASPPSTVCGPKGFETTHALHGTNDAPLFQGEVNGNPVTCTIGTTLAGGTYRVRLYFAEIYWGAGCSAPGGIGTRVFDIALEGTTVLRNFDVFAESGGCMASTTSTNGVPVVKTFDVTVSDGTLDISLSATQDQAKISALEVFGPL
jgi:hypothetical protein